ncbi:membrane protein [Paraliobacillus quinghaiensis]|uniref:Membrane protein n=1 Tax=Paraliobacillus quinghaiensis TaxID=470815 RepID=A0A917TU76_9BACI|nr:cytochrome c biogenesis protein CcdC [Paraliobacillus quinghaiensis]GGM37592.1 membrane protein [Paraliobacillus quinghaiensis]
MFWAIASTVVGLIMASLMIFIRARASKRPTNGARILLPPLFMSTGAFMFIIPMFRVSFPQVIEALVIGIIFSVFLIKSTSFQIEGKNIYLKPSKYFIIILVGLLIARIILKVMISSTISVGETSGMFFLLAFGMIVTWRLVMFFNYQKLKKEL